MMKNGFAIFAVLILLTSCGASSKEAEEAYEEGYSFAYDQYRASEHEIKKLEEEVAEYYELCEEERRYACSLEEELIDIIDFYSEYAVFVANKEIIHENSSYNSDSKTFTKYEEIFPINTYHKLSYIYYHENAVDEYAVYTRKEAEDKGYVRCSNCFYESEYKFGYKPKD